MSNTPVGTIPVEQLAPLNEETRITMRDEFKISFILAVLYFLFLFAVPVLNWKAPGLMKSTLWGGMSLTWFLTGIVAMFVAFAVAALHVYFYQKRFLHTSSEQRTDSFEKAVNH